MAFMSTLPAVSPSSWVRDGYRARTHA
jgi:hypothetical protein